MEKTEEKITTDSKSGRLKQLRISLNNMTQEKFASMLGIDQSNVTKYERGKMEIGKSLEFKLYHVFSNLNPLWWETGDGQIFIEGVAESMQQNQSQGSNLEMEALRRENENLLSTIKAQEATIRAYESAIKANEAMIEMLKEKK